MLIQNIQSQNLCVSSKLVASFIGSIATNFQQKFIIQIHQACLFIHCFIPVCFLHNLSVCVCKFRMALERISNRPDYFLITFIHILNIVNFSLLSYEYFTTALVQFFTYPNGLRLSLIPFFLSYLSYFLVCFRLRFLFCFYSCFPIFSGWLPRKVKLTRGQYGIKVKHRLTEELNI